MKKMSSKWHAVSIVMQETSCAAAALCRNKRFLSSQIPSLPLRDCDRAASCPCKFKHYDDRRCGRAPDRRRAPRLEVGIPRAQPPVERGRRAVDSR